MLKLKEGSSYIRRDGRLTTVTKTGYSGFIAFRGSDLTFYSKDGHANTSLRGRDIVLACEEDECKSEGWDTIVSITLVMAILSYLWYSLLK